MQQVGRDIAGHLVPLLFAVVLPWDRRRGVGAGSPARVCGARNSEQLAVHPMQGSTTTSAPLPSAIMPRPSSCAFSFTLLSKLPLVPVRPRHTLAALIEETLELLVAGGGDTARRVVQSYVPSFNYFSPQVGLDGTRGRWRLGATPRRGGWGCA